MKAEARGYSLYIVERQKLELACWIYCISLLHLSCTFLFSRGWAHRLLSLVPWSYSMLLYNAWLCSYTHHFSWAAVRRWCINHKCTTSIIGNGLSFCIFLQVFGWGEKTGISLLAVKGLKSVFTPVSYERIYILAVLFSKSHMIEITVFLNDISFTSLHSMLCLFLQGFWDIQHQTLN